MKTNWGVAIAFTFLVGCSDQKNQQLESRVKAIEMSYVPRTQVERLENELESVRSNHTSFMTNFFLTMNDAAYLITNGLEDINVLIDSHSVAIHSITSRQPARYFQQIAPAVKFGIPATVYDRIVKDAQLQWPADYKMQEHTIKEQTEAYRRLHP